MSDHERVQAALREFDALSPVEAAQDLSPLECGMALAIYDSTRDVATMHDANRIARAVREYLVGKIQTNPFDWADDEGRKV